MYLWYRTLYPYQSDPSSGQLSFQPGAVLVVRDSSPAKANGWAYGRFANSSKSQGWFPLSYVQEIPDPRGIRPVVPENRAFPEVAETDSQSSGFMGAPMGGETTGSTAMGGGAPFSSLAIARATSSSIQESSPEFGKSPNLFRSRRDGHQGSRPLVKNVGKGFSKAASKTKTAFSKAGSAITHASSKSPFSKRNAEPPRPRVMITEASL